MRNENAEKKYLELVDEIVKKGPFKPSWDSLSKARVPEWFGEERLGIFTHWGLYSVPANSNEWYSRNMYIESMPAFEHHVKNYGAQKDFGYKDFIPLFKAENFDADEWIRLFKEAGAGYIFPVAEHHDGFQMYESDLSDFNAADMGPKRDVIGELKAAAEKAGLYFCTSTHRAEHWFFMSHGKEFESDIKEPLKKGDFYWPAMPEPNTEDLFSKPAPTEEYLNDWLARTAELIYKYRPRLLYFDWWIQHAAFRPYLKRLMAFYYNCGVMWGQDVMICYKLDSFAFGTGIYEVERGGFSEPKPYRWQTDTAAARNSWCYTDSLDYKSSNELIINLIDAVSKNGNLLLNIGPRADGVIPDRDKELLKDIGAWVRINGEAIKGSRPWRKAYEGPTNNKEGQFQDGEELKYTSKDFRFTVKGGCLYAICLKCPEDGCFDITSLRDSYDPAKREAHIIIDKIEILGYAGELSYAVDEEALHIKAPGIKSDFPVTVKIKVL